MESLFNVIDSWPILALGILLGASSSALVLFPRLITLRERLKITAKSHADSMVWQESLQLKLKDMAGDALRQNSEDFLILANQTLHRANQISAQDLERRQEGINAMLKPLKETLEQYRVQTSAGQGALKQQIDGLTTLGQDMNRQAAALRNALTSSPRGAGAWGEHQLKNVMTMAGMAEHVDFDLQAHFKSQDGKILRPDALIRLPGQGCIVIDAKAPLKAFVDSHDVSDHDQANKYLRDFVNALRTHITDLGKKAYWENIRSTPEFVVLFLPNDSMLTTALEISPDLLELAAAQRVVLSSPGTLIALLTTVAHAWRQESLHQNSQEIADLGGKLYDALSSFSIHFERLHKSIHQTAKAYSGMVGSLDNNVMPKARRFRDLQMDPGAKSILEPKTLHELDLRDPSSLRNFAPLPAFNPSPDDSNAR